GIQVSEASYVVLRDSYWEGLTVILGTNNAFIVEFSSLYNGILSDFKATLMIYDFVSSTYSTSSSYIGSIFRNQSLYLRFNVTVPSNAYASHYKADLTLSFRADGVPQAQRIPLFVTIQGEPKLRCDISGNVRPGWPAILYLSMSNLGDGVARNVVVSLTPTTIGVQVASPLEIGIVNPMESRRIPFVAYIGDNIDEAVTITATVTWGAQVGPGGQYTTTQTLEVLETESKGLKLSTKNYYLDPGRINTIILSVENEGNEWAYRTRLSLQAPPGAAVMGSSSFDLGDLAPSKVTFIPINLSLNSLESGPIQVLATLEWLDSGGEQRTSSLTLGFYVRVPEGPYLVVLSDTKVLKPGVPEPVRIILKNEGQEVARRLRMSLVPSKDLALLSEAGFDLGDIEPGGILEISALLYAANISYGSLILTTELSYLDEHDSVRNQVIPITFITEPPKQPLLMITLLNPELETDETSVLEVEIRNEGGVARDLRVELAFPSPELGSLVGAGRAYIDSLDRGESAIRNFTLYLSPKAYGAVQLIARLNYRDESGVEHLDVTTLGVKASGQPRIEVAHVSTIPTPVYPGDSNIKLIVLVTNLGNYIAKDLRLNITSLPRSVEPSYSGSDTFLIPALPPGGNVEVRFLLNVREEAEPGRYDLKLISRYGETTLPLQIDEKAYFRLVEFSVSGKPKPGDRGVRISFTLRNEARVDTSDTVVEVITPYLTGTTSLALGDIPGRSNSSAVIEVDIDKQAPLEVPLDIRVSWKQEGRSLSQTIKTTLMLQKGNEIDTLGVTAILTAAILLLVLIMVIKRGRVN
ncbi:MAG: hypothetical protein NZ992_06360, partial [Candidatus Korarchaeum sp.]|nr:hypothetical protein [Candidatus Korarchaeum sp.]MDW8035634.1 hypothetical protein [Candidatus Korarchaeum sp.]